MRPLEERVLLAIARGGQRERALPALDHTLSGSAIASENSRTKCYRLGIRYRGLRNAAAQQEQERATGTLVVFVLLAATHQ